MGYTTKQLFIIQHILHEAEKEIFERTGMQASVMLCKSDLNVQSPSELLNVVAMALKMNPESFRYSTRKMEVVEMRFIAARLLKRVFPSMNLTEIGELFGGQDHSTISSGLKQSENFIQQKDVDFCKKYKVAEDAVNEWLFITKHTVSND